MTMQPVAYRVELIDHVTISLAELDANLAVLTKGGRLTSIAVAESTGAAAASFDLIDGNDATGTVILPVRLAQGASLCSGFGPGGLVFRRGLLLRANAGDVVGSVTVATPVIVDLTA